MRAIQENDYAINNLLSIKTLNLNQHFTMDPQIRQKYTYTGNKWIKVRHFPPQSGWDLTTDKFTGFETYGN